MEAKIGELSKDKAMETKDIETLKQTRVIKGIKCSMCRGSWIWQRGGSR